LLRGGRRRFAYQVDQRLNRIHAAVESWPAQAQFRQRLGEQPLQAVDAVIDAGISHAPLD
jgi:hypothetical protein